ncbi:DUF5123 domain-containing protein [Wenyingzhuangia marina]|uniref:Fibronectin type-III domain-containing protein n=1 Tax=Wenyingzhuangia marina TaxID=1195760 RepID=A0A1M5V9B7_9FLAO|nr:DUF5123 domain-containing protein [Wenyingzhuangia marina]GGF73592.1 hypothetical protein GCM10011397_15650 [Wenyingzhuangia marina]SHH71728.1 protein of unknown function [Wenyingzhuangia marina]
MKTKNIYKGFIAFLAFIVASCSYDEEVVESLSINREFAPVSLSTIVRNQTYVEMSWTVDDNIDSYIVEFSADDPDFTTIYETVEVTAEELPITVRLEGETVYSVRVKAKSARELDDSSWALGEFTTLSEQIMLPYELGDADDDNVTLRWEAGLNVTHFMLQPGDIRHDITAQEKIDGVANITGLTSETEYKATLYNNAKQRGFAEITTGVAVGNNTLVSTTDDLIQILNNAQDGEIILIDQGDFTAQTGTITLDKSITIRGLKTDFKPKLSLNFEFNAGATDVNLIDLDLDGATTIQDVARYTGAGNYNSLLIKGCNIHDFDRSFIAGNTTDAIVQSVTVEDCIVTNVVTNGGDFIDFRNSDVFNVTVRTSTFNNCAPGRDFFRIDDAGTSTQNGLVCNVLLENSTLYGCCDSSSKRVLYIRFQTNDIIVQNTLITDTGSEGYSDQSRTDDTVTFSNNNYFNADGFFNPSQTVFDGSGTQLDPEFADPLNGDFTIGNQTIKDNLIGDPRWIK